MSGTGHMSERSRGRGEREGCGWTRRGGGDANCIVKLHQTETSEQQRRAKTKEHRCYSHFPFELVMVWKIKSENATSTANAREVTGPPAGACEGGVGICLSREVVAR